MEPWPWPPLRVAHTGAWLAGPLYLLGLVKSPVLLHGARVSVPGPVFPGDRAGAGSTQSLKQGLTHFYRRQPRIWPHLLVFMLLSDPLPLSVGWT